MALHYRLAMGANGIYYSKKIERTVTAEGHAHAHSPGIAIMRMDHTYEPEIFQVFE